MKSILLLGLILLSLGAQARVYDNKAFSFEIPDEWNCKQKDSEWVCKIGEATESMIVLSIKKAGAADTFDAYQEKLSQTKPGSQIKYLRTNKLAGHVWVDSLQMGSIVPNHLSHYMATIKDKMALLIVLTSTEEKFPKSDLALTKVVNSVLIKESI